MTSLYTSYYTRQLALRPESVSTPDAEEGPKSRQPAVPRRTVDVTGPYVPWLQSLPCMSRDPWRRPALSPGPDGALGLPPPAGLAAAPASGATPAFAAQAPSKTRSSINVVCWVPDGRRCLSGTHMGEFTLWDGATFQFESILQAHEAPLRALRYTHSGTFLVSGDDRGLVRYWRPNFELVKSTQAHGEALRALSFAASDLKFATASDDGTVRIWDFARVECEQSLRGHGGDVRAAAWHPSRALVASGAKDGLVKLWDPRAGRAAATLHAHRATVTEVAWNRGGRLLLSAGRDAACRVWDARVPGREPLATAREPRAKDFTAAAWHPTHGALFGTGTVDGTLAYWLADDGTGSPIQESRGAHESSVWAMRWNPSGHLLVSGGADLATKFWARLRPSDPFYAEQVAAQRDQAAWAAGTAPGPRPRPDTAAPGGGLGVGPRPFEPPGLASAGAPPGLAGATGPAPAMGAVGIPGLGPNAPAGPLHRGRRTHPGDGDAPGDQADTVAKRRKV